jgi:hypothetical protein
VAYPTAASRIFGFGLYILAFRDPDNIQLELTATYN